MDTTESEASRRLTEIEIKLSYSEDLIETLNHTVYRQQQQIEALLRRLAELERQVQAIPSRSGAAPASLRDEIPPHY